MGSTLSAITSSLASDAEQEKQAGDALNSLLAIADTRQKAFYEHITSPTFDPKTIPINKVIYKYQYFRCGVEKDAAKIVGDIKSGLNSFITGDVADGLAKIATSCLEALFGSYAANQSATTTYAISTGSLGGVARIDADFYSYQYNSATLSKITKNVVVVSIVISSAQIDGLSRNDISTIVQTVYSGSTPEEQKAIRDQIWASIQEDKPHPDTNSGSKSEKSGAAPNRLDRLPKSTFENLNDGIHGDLAIRQS